MHYDKSLSCLLQWVIISVHPEGINNIIDMRSIVSTPDIICQTRRSCVGSFTLNNRIKSLFRLLSQLKFCKCFSQEAANEQKQTGRDRSRGQSLSPLSNHSAVSEIIST